MTTLISSPSVSAPASTNLYAASREWANRPEDERFASLADLHAHCLVYKKGAAEADNVPLNTLRVHPGTGAESENLELVGSRGINTRFTNWSFGQLCRNVGAPAGYLATLPAELASNAMNYSLSRVEADRKSNILLHKNGHWSVRAVTGTSYDRIWNSDVTSRLLDVGARGWVVPPARPVKDGQRGSRIATAADCIPQPGFSLAVQPGDTIAPAGLYASDRDMFAFLVNPNRELRAGGARLFRGVFVSNSEVGDKSFRITKFLFNNVCGNHIVWGASDVISLAIRHVGNANQRAGEGLYAQLEQYSESSAAEEQQKIESSARFLLGNNKDEVLDQLFGLKILPRKTLDAAYDRAVECVETDAPGVSPNSAWGFVQGLTRVSQESPYADERTDMDVAGGKVLKLAF